MSVPEYLQKFQNKKNMSDNQLLYFSSILCFILILFLSKPNKYFFLINIGIFVLYSSFLYYKLLCQSNEGSALLWFFYLEVITVIQILLIGIYLLIKFFK